MSIEDLAARARAAQEPVQRREPAPAPLAVAESDTSPERQPAPEELEVSQTLVELKAREKLDVALESVVSLPPAPPAEGEIAAEALEARERLEGGFRGMLEGDPPGAAERPAVPARAVADTPLPPTLWNEHAVNVVNQRGQEQNGIQQDEIDRNTRLAQEHLAGGGQVQAEDLAALAREAGVDPARLDPAQLEAATRYVQGGQDEAGQAERLRKTLNNFNVLDQVGLPHLSRQEANDLMWGVARVPGHATQKLDEAGLSQTFQEVAAAVASPGEHKFKVGQHTLEMNVDPAGQVTDSKTSAPSALSKIGGYLKTAIPIAATVAAFIPGVGTAVAAGLRIASAAISGIEAVKNDNFLGVLGAVAGGVGAGFSLGASATAGRVASIANSVGSGARGVQSIKQGGVLGVVGGVAGVAGAAAGLSGLDAADDVQNVTGKVATAANRVETAQRFRVATGAVEQSERQLAAARASGDPAAVARAQEQLEEARRFKQTALLAGLGAVADIGASHTGGGTSQALGYASRGLDMAADIQNRDFLGAAAGAVGIAGQASGSQRLQDVASVTEQGNNFRLARQGEQRAEQAVVDAERTLQLARNSGNPEAVRQAQEALEGARGQRNFAESNSFFAGDQLAATGQGIGQRLESERQFERNLQALAPSLEQGQKAMSELESVARNPRATGGFQDMAEQARQGLEQAHDELAAALFSGDKTRIADARARFESASAQASERASLLEQVFAPAELASPGLATDLRLPPAAAPTVPPTSAPALSASRPVARPTTPAPGQPQPQAIPPESIWAPPANPPQNPAPPFSNAGNVPELREQWQKDLQADPQYRDRSLALMRQLNGAGGALETVKQARGGDDNDGYTAKQVEDAQNALRGVFGRELTPFELRNMDHFLNNYAGMSNLRPDPNDSEWTRALKTGPGTLALDMIYQGATPAYTAVKAIFGGVPGLFSNKQGVTGAPDALDWRSGIEGLWQYRRDLEHYSRTGEWRYGSDWTPPQPRP